jgi:PAS domain S-box-containing protein
MKSDSNKNIKTPNEEIKKSPPASTRQHTQTKQRVVVPKDGAGREALKELAENYHTILDNSLNGTVVVEAATAKILFANKAALKMYGFNSLEELGEANLLDYIHPDDKERTFVAFVKDFFENTSHEQYEFRTISKDGTEKRVLSYSVPIQYQNKLCGVISFIDITERTKMEEALRASEEKLRAMFESMSEAATITDMKGRIIDANPAAVKLHRYNDKKELIGINAAELVADRDRDRAIKDSIEALKTNQSRPAEYKLTTKGGTLIDGEFCTAVIRDHAGNPCSFIGISRDISDRKRMEEKLRETERKLETIFNSIMDGLIITDMMGTVMDANEAAVHIGKYSKLEELIGHSGIDFITESERKRVAKALLAAIADTKKTHSDIIEYIAQDKDGTPFYGETSAAAIRDSSGKPTGMIFVTRDITERKRLEDKVKEDEEKLRAMFEAITSGICVTDLQGNVTEINATLIKLGGFSTRDELIGKNALEFIAPKDRDIAAQRIAKRVAAGHGTDTSEYTFITKDGREFDGELSIGMIHNKEDKPVSIVAIARDITKRKHAEEALRENEEKYREVVERASDGIVILQDLKVRYANPRVAEIAGYKPEELLGSSMSNYIHPDELPKVTERYEQRLRGEDIPQIYETALLHKDGSKINVELNAGVTTYHGKPADLVIIRNITERKQVEQKLRASEERYRLLAENMSDVIFIVDLNFKFLYLSPSVYQLRGYTVEEAMQLPIEKTVTPASLERITKTLTEQLELLKSGKRDPHEAHTIEMEEYRKDGSTVWVELKLNGIYDKDGNLTSLLGVTRDITVRRRVNEIIQAKEQELRSIFESMSDCLVITDEQLHIVNVNDGGSQLTGFTKEELIGRNAIEMLDKSDLDRAMTSLANRTQKGLTLSREDFKLRLKDGSLRDVDINISNLNDASGKVIGFVCVIRDITERKKMEDALRTSEERLRAVYASLADALVITDKNLIMIDCNDRALQMGGGYPRDQIIGRPGTDLLHEDDRQRAIDELAKRFMGQASPERQDYRIKTMDGSIRYTEMSIATLKDAKEEIIGFVAVLRDTTERRQMEEAIHTSHKLLSTVFESMHDGLAIMDKDGKFVQWNQATLDISGFKAEELPGKSGIDIIIPEDRGRLTEELTKQFMGAAPERQSCRVQLPGGVLKYVELSVSALKDDAGNITGFVSSTRDVTKRIAMERALKKALDDLQRSNKELEQFAYVASHDLQEPLRMISSYTQLLAKRYKGKLDTDADEFIGFAVDGADRMQKMIQDLLAYSRVNTRGKEFEPVDLEKTFSDATDNLKIAIEDNKATITHDPLPRVLADDSQMVRLFQNLIGNSLKFHGAEPPVIHVSCKDGESDYTIAIKDNGIGIDKQYLNRLFIIFQRLHTRDQYPGTGIGLAVCKRTVERHGGSIWLESEGAGKGSIFMFTIPKRDLAKKVEPGKALVENDQENNPDDREVKKLLMKILNDWQGKK